MDGSVAKSTNSLGKDVLVPRGVGMVTTELFLTACSSNQGVRKEVLPSNFLLLRGSLMMFLESYEIVLSCHSFADDKRLSLGV